MVKEGLDLVKVIEQGQAEDNAFMAKRKAEAFKNLEDIKISNEVSISLK
jgi:hypothetical protein